MYLESIEIHNFGPVKYRKLDFVDGLVVVRGSNERGKSTSIIQCPLYAFFGSSTLDCSIDHVTHNGQPVSSLKVVAKYGPYTVSRTKASASVVGPGVKISGQAEVSNFFYNLFGISPKTEKLVLVSAQGDTAGVINRGNSDVTSFIEDIAGFDQIASLLERIKQTYPIGSEKALKGQLEAAEAEQLQYSQEELPDLKQLTEGKETTVKEILTQTDLVNKKRAWIKSLEANLKTIELENQNITSIAKAASNKKVDIQWAESALTKAQQEADQIPAYCASAVDAATALIEEFPSRELSYKAYQWVESIKPSEHYWDEHEQGLTDRIQELYKNITQQQAIISSKQGEIKSLQKGIQTDDICTKCGSDIKTKKEEINKKINGEIEKLTSGITRTQKILEDDKAEKQILDQIKETHDRLEREAKVHGEYVRAIKKEIPYTYEITGFKPLQPDQGELVSAKRLLADYQQSRIKSSSCQAIITEKTSALDKLRTELVEKELELKDAGELQDTTEKRTEIFNEECALTKLVETQTELNNQLTNKEKEIVAAEAKIETNKNNLIRVKKTITEINTALRVEDRNGKIIKAVREAKPRVLNQIWDKVISYVSQSFSEMRGYDSEVEKTDKGFAVDQRPTSRLSGSAKSILGIALRSAIRDIFAPTAGFMIFDEVFADCDEERTAAALAAIQTIRGQKFIVTHESQSEMAADQVIEI